MLKWCSLPAPATLTPLRGWVDPSFRLPIIPCAQGMVLSISMVPRCSELLSKHGPKSGQNTVQQWSKKGPNMINKGHHVKHGPKIVRKWSKRGQAWPQKWHKMVKTWPKMAKQWPTHGQKWSKHGPTMVKKWQGVHRGGRSAGTRAEAYAGGR